MNHRISVNGNLNVYSFLITLLHELAHLLTFEQHGNRVQSHGREWKNIYGQLLDQFLKNKKFPPDIEKELLQSLKNPAATSCAEDDLLRVLANTIKRTTVIYWWKNYRKTHCSARMMVRVFKKGKKCVSDFNVWK